MINVFTESINTNGTLGTLHVMAYHLHAYVHNSLPLLYLMYTYIIMFLHY